MHRLMLYAADVTLLAAWALFWVSVAVMRRAGGKAWIWGAALAGLYMLMLGGNVAMGIGRVPSADAALDPNYYSLYLFPVMYIAFFGAHNFLFLDDDPVTRGQLVRLWGLGVTLIGATMLLVALASPHHGHGRFTQGSFYTAVGMFTLVMAWIRRSQFRRAPVEATTP